jgi:hypothetical protein
MTPSPKKPKKGTKSKSGKKVDNDDVLEEVPSLKVENLYLLKDVPEQYQSAGQNGILEASKHKKDMDEIELSLFNSALKKNKTLNQEYKYENDEIINLSENVARDCDYIMKIFLKKVQESERPKINKSASMNGE